MAEEEDGDWACDDASDDGGAASVVSTAAKTAAASVASAKAGRGKGRGRGKSAGGRGKGKGRGKSKQISCIVSGCPEPPKKHGETCQHHDRLIAAMKYQAGRDGELAALSQVLEDPHRLKLAILDFEKNNVIEGKFRYKKLDWAIFKRVYGVRVSFTVREGEEQMDKAEHEEYFLGKSKSQTWIDSDWNTLLANAKDDDKEGTGANLKLWVPLRKQRFRDRTRFQEGAAEQSTKQEKNVGDTDLQALMKVAESSTSFGEQWMQGAVPDTSNWQQPINANASTSSGGAEAEAQGVGAAGKHVGKAGEEVIFMAPVATKRHQDGLPNLIAEVQKTIECATQALQECEARTQSLESTGCAIDSLQADYELTLRVRLRLSQVWCAASPADLDEMSKPVSSLMKSKSDKSGSIASPSSKRSAKDQQQIASNIVTPEGPKGVEAEGEPGEPKRQRIESAAAEAEGEGAGEAAAGENGAAADRQTATAADDAKRENEAKDDDEANEPKEQMAEAREAGPNSQQQAPAATAMASPAKSAASMSSESCPAIRMTSILQREVKAAGNRSPYGLVVEQLKANTHCKQLFDNFMTCETIVDLTRATKMFVDAIEMTKLLRAGTTKAASTLRGHIIAQDRTAKRKASSLQEQRALDTEKKKAKDAANAIRKAAEAVPSIFSLDMSASTEKFKAIAMFNKDTLDKMDVCTPAVFRGLEFVTQFGKEPRVQMLLSTWAGTYKKSCKDTGRTQKSVLTSNAAKTSLNELWKDVTASMPSEPLVDLATTNAVLKSLLAVDWLYGYQPEHHNIAATPNGLGMWKLLQAGEVQNLMVPIADLVAAVKIAKGSDDPLTMANLRDDLKTITVERLAAMSIQLHHHKQTPGDLLWIPTGWLLAELCTSGVLIYGIRKSMLVQAPQAASNYENIIECLQAENIDVSNYSATMPFLKGGDDEE